jgi:hypothetical protein
MCYIVAKSGKENKATMTTPTLTLDQVIDSAMQLPPDQQEMLVSILHKRQIESRRREIALDAQEALIAYRDGELDAQPAEEAIRELRQALEDDE